MLEKRSPGFFSLADLPRWDSIADLALTSGWPELDEIWKIYPGQFTVVTGIAGHGKSTFAQNVVVNLARGHGMKSFLYVPENERYMHQKMRGIWGDQPGFNVFAAEQCFVQSSIPEFYDDDPKTLPWVLDQATAVIEKHGIDLVLIDPWNELERARGRDELLTDYISQCLMYLKQFCRATKVAVVLVAHPTKSGISDGKVPGLADIEGSMAWFNKCDNGLIVHREADSSTTRVISAKAREIGSGRRGQCWFTVSGDTGLFTPQYGAVQ